MARSIILSNGELCVMLDKYAAIRDMYYPHVGLEDHVSGRFMHRCGTWVDGEMSWLGEDMGWEITVLCEENALQSVITAKNPRLAVSLTFHDVIYNERSILFRRVEVRNEHDHAREIRLYFAQQFEIAKSYAAETAYFDPASTSLIHYKGRRVFLINALLDGKPFSDFAVGQSNYEGHEGTFRDAGDGRLSKNPIELGSVDSVLGLYANYEAGQSRTCHYWIVAAQIISDAVDLNDYVLRKTPQHLEDLAVDYWNSWLKRSVVNKPDFSSLPSQQQQLFKHSLMYTRAHVDRDGGVIASLDSDMLQYGNDTYSYVWPRDAALCVLALDAAGDKNPAKRFFEFSRVVMSGDGYFMHKYLPDRSLGSSWHPWIVNDEFQLPIQEDETALVVYALYAYYRRNNDIGPLEAFYTPLVERAADFMVEYRDTGTRLPGPSYDLWEIEHGISTFTSSAVYGALIAAAELSKIMRKTENETRYRAAAEEIRSAILEHLWDERSGAFVRYINRTSSGLVYNRTIDASSAYGVFAFGVLALDDPRLDRAWATSVRVLSHGIPAGGLARFEGDRYYRRENDSVGNPWIITTLWYAEYLIARAKKRDDLQRVEEIFRWVALHAQPSGILSEQLDPATGAQLSAAPLAWSHAAYVSATLKYLDKLKQFTAR